MAVSFLGTAAMSMASLPMPSYSMSLQQQLALLVPSEKIQEPETIEIVPEKLKEKWFTCKDCNQNEIYILNALQERGVSDKNAIATIMGNIKQESRFIPNICEGGSIIPYHHCRSGGFGFLQWTDSTRYYGLGNFAARINGDPSSLKTQVKYMFHEGDWKMIEDKMKTPGKSIHDYMRLARRWIRWGHHGARTDFAYDYARRLISESDS